MPSSHQKYLLVSHFLICYRFSLVDVLKECDEIFFFKPQNNRLMLSTDLDTYSTYYREERDHMDSNYC